MKKIVMYALKGGTGKTTLSAHLARAMKGKGYEVAILDLDIMAPNTPYALGHSIPKLLLSTGNETIIPPKMNGIGLVSMASHFGEGTRILWNEENIRELTGHLLGDVIDWGDAEYVIIDCPPSQGTPIMTLLDSIKDIYGALIITQPSDFSVADTRRVVDLFKEYGVPLFGIISNMDGVVCPHCNEEFYGLLSQRVDIEKFCEEENLPFLMKIPQTKNIDEYGNRLASIILDTEPTSLPAGRLTRDLRRSLSKKLLERRFSQVED